MKFDIARQILIKEAEQSRKLLIEMMEGGNRDFGSMEIYFQKYINCLMASDSLLDLELHNKVGLYTRREDIVPKGGY